MDTKEVRQNDVYVKFLQNAFGYFYGKDNVNFRREEEKDNIDSVMQESMSFLVKDRASKNDERIKVSFVHRSELFDSFLFESFQDNLYRNNILNSTEVENFGRRIYQKACLLFEEYMKVYFHIFIEDIIEISATYYEGSEVEGNICFFLDAEDELTLKLDENQFSEKCSFSGTNIKKIRKMLEITKGKISENSFGLVFSFYEKWWFRGFVDGIPKDKHLIYFSFVRHMVWDMYWGSKKILRYNCGRYVSPVTNYKAIFEKKIIKLIEKSNDKLWNLVSAAIGQKHGTTLVIICEKKEVVKNKVEELVKCSSGTLLNIESLKPEYVSRLTAIDGALIIDSEGNGYGYGMILAFKGNEKIKRDPGRGARFNSAKLYIADQLNCGIKAMAIIVSEDGMVHFYSTNDAEKEGTENAD